MTSPPNLQNSPLNPDVVDLSESDIRRRGFYLNGWWIEPTRNRIASNDLERRLDPRVMDVLVYLATRPGEVVSRDELISAIWEDSIVGDNTVSQAISRLRKALGDDHQSPRFIETISKSGYRLVAELQSEAKNRAPRDRPTAVDGSSERPSGRWARAARRLLPFGVALVAGLTGIWYGSGRSVPDPPSALELTPELTLVGNQFEPTLSPQGDRIAFCWRKDEQDTWSVWIQPVGGDHPVRLTDSKTHERLPTWTPDGQSLVFARFSEDGTPLGFYRQSILGGPAERLADSEQGIRSMHLSPDGQTLALSIRHSPEEPTGIEVLDLANGTRRVLTTPSPDSVGDRNPTFSPDGRRIAFERRHHSSRQDVMTVDLPSGELKTLTNDTWGRLFGLDWRSDGDAVVFSSNRSGQFALWQVPAAGGEPTRLPIHDTWTTQPSISRQGGRLIYRTFRDVVNIWSLPLDVQGLGDGEPIQRVASTRTERHPVWSPDGQSLAFLSDRSGTTELWSGRADGSDLMRHTHLSGALPQSPSWSPDGTRIIFDAAPEGQSDLWMVSRDSRSPIRLTSEVTEERNATFSRDGRWIYFASDRGGAWQVWRRSSAGGNSTAMTEAGGFLAHESIDGDQLYFVMLNQPGIWRMPAKGGEAEVVLENLDLSDWGSWVVGEKGIYFVQRNPTTIQRLNFADGSIQRVFTPPQQIPYLGRSLSLSPDGRALLFAMIEYSDDEVMRVEYEGL